MDPVYIADTILDYIEDQPSVVEDVKRNFRKSDDFKKIGIRHIEPEIKSYYGMLLETLFGCPKGILIDVDLNLLGYPPIELLEYPPVENDYYGSAINNGINIALFLYKFCPHIPISVYTSHPDDFKKEMETLPSPIHRFQKTEEVFDKMLSPFIEKVLRSHQKGYFFEMPPYSSFVLLDKKIQMYYIKLACSHIDSNKYFELVGDYRWFAVCKTILRNFHGENQNDLSAEQEELRQSYGINCQKIPNFPALKEIAVKHHELPFIYWNFRDWHNLNINLKVYNDCLESLSSECCNMFQIQAAQALASFFHAGQPNVDEIKMLLNKLDDYGKFEFQKKMLKLNRNSIKSVSVIQSFLKPFKPDLKEVFMDYFIGRIDEIEQETDTAWVSLENLFDNDIQLYEPFSIQKLREYLPVVGKGASFEFIVYKNNLGNDSFAIEPLI